MNRPTVDAKWCHVIWSTYRHRERFKLAAEAIFCERAIRRVGNRLGWPIEAVSVSEDSVHILVRVPIGSTRGEVISQLKRNARDELVQAGKLTRRAARTWARNGWCSVVTSPRAVNTTRHYIRSRSKTPESEAVKSASGAVWPSNGPRPPATITYSRA